MKKGVVVIWTSLTILIFMIYGFTNCTNGTFENVAESNKGSIAYISEESSNLNKKSDPNFFFGINPRYNGIKKSDLDKAIFIDDFLTEEQLPPVNSYESISIMLVKDNKRTNIVALSDTNKLSKSQLELFKSTDYSSSFLIKGNYKNINEETLQSKYNFWSPHFTIIPEKQAIYMSNQNDLKQYLEDGYQKAIAYVLDEKLNLPLVYFTITKLGAISDVRLESSSIYPMVDKKIIELINNLPGTWYPAKNEKGQNVDQELFLTFGIGGC